MLIDFSDVCVQASLYDVTQCYTMIHQHDQHVQSDSLILCNTWCPCFDLFWWSDVFRNTGFFSATGAQCDFVLCSSCRHSAAWFVPMGGQVLCNVHIHVVNSGKPFTLNNPWTWWFWDGLSHVFIWMTLHRWDTCSWLILCGISGCPAPLWWCIFRCSFSGSRKSFPGEWGEWGSFMVFPDSVPGLTWWPS